MTPRPARVSSDSRQRTGDTSWADSRPSPAVRWAAASTLATTSMAGGPRSARPPGRRPAGPAPAAMRGEWKAPPTGSGMTRLAPSSLAASPAASTPCGGAGDDHLPGGVVVGRPGPFDPLAGLGPPAAFQTEDGGHGAGLGIGRSLHGFAPGGDQAGALPRGSGRSAATRAVYSPEAVAGHGPEPVRTRPPCVGRPPVSTAQPERSQLGVAGGFEGVRVRVDQKTFRSRPVASDRSVRRPPRPGWCRQGTPICWTLRALTGEKEGEHAARPYSFRQARRCRVAVCRAMPAVPTPAGVVHTPSGRGT